MPSKFHVNRAGKVTACRATTKPCPLRGQHYTTAEEAQNFLDMRDQAREQLRIRNARQMEAEERAEQQAENYRNEADLLNSNPNNNPGDVWMIQNPGTSNVDYIPVNLTHIEHQTTITSHNTSHLERSAYLIRAQDEYNKQPEGCWDCGTTNDNTSMRWDAAALEMRDSYELRVSCDKCEHEALWDV